MIWVTLLGLKLKGLPSVDKEGVAKSKKALNHKDTKAQRKPFLSALGRPEKNFVSPCLGGSLLFRAFCDNSEGRFYGCFHVGGNTLDVVQVR